MKVKHVHFMGIGGSGASAVAAIAQSQGYQISGCDHHPHNEFTIPLNLESQFLFEGHSVNHLNNVDILAISPAIPSLDPNNPELLAAQKQGIEVLTWQQFMGKYLEEKKFVIAVCGTHGKSTTTAMTASLLEDAGLDPTVEIGATMSKWGKNYRVGKGQYFVTEADEFNENFLVTHPDIAVVTTIEMDHPEYYKDFESYKKSFKKFLSQTKKAVVANLSDPGVKEVVESLQGDPLIIDYSQNLINFSLPIPGEYNRYNASAVFEIGKLLGIDPQVIEKGLQTFSGIGRRFEFLGHFKEAKVYSDFGHHPTEIKVTLDALRQRFPQANISVVFQPHMFSRTHYLFNDFVKTLKEAPVDQIMVMDIYPSREVDTGLVNSKQLVEAINKDSVIYVPTGDEVLQKIKHSDKDMLFFLGAGSTHDLAKQLLNQ